MTDVMQHTDCEQHALDESPITQPLPTVAHHAPRLGHAPTIGMVPPSASSSPPAGTSRTDGWRSAR
jgi:hypothetical protein